MKPVIGCLGAGRMGRGIAVVFAFAGHQVVIVDFKQRDAAAFDAALGESLCVLALANRDLSGPMQPIAPYDRLGVRVIEDGLRCLGAWCTAQTAGVGQRVRLKLSPHPALDDAVVRPFDELGPAIVRRTVG